jgi:hypothetical protein
MSYKDKNDGLVQVFLGAALSLAASGEIINPTSVYAGNGYDELVLKNCVVSAYWQTGITARRITLVDCVTDDGFFIKCAHGTGSLEDVVSKPYRAHALLDDRVE